MVNKTFITTPHAKIMSWIKDVLNESEINALTVVSTHWSNVLEINVQQKVVYLKHTSSALFVEVDVIQKCRELCGITDIPEVIAANKDLHCFLMKECGDASLRTVFDGSVNVELLVKSLGVYTSIQQKTILHVDEFISIGVPDWRLGNFPKLYQEIISDKKFLKEHALKEEHILILENAVAKVELLCQKLSSYGISECLNHSDFHDNNILLSSATQKISIIDLGETAINHPLFSRAAFLKSICERYNIQLDCTDYRKLYNACFNGFLLSSENLQTALVVIEILLPVYLLLAQKRFLDAIDLPYSVNNPISIKQHNKINKGLIWFIDNIKNAAL